MVFVELILASVFFRFRCSRLFHPSPTCCWAERRRFNSTPCRCFRPSRPKPGLSHPHLRIGSPRRSAEPDDPARRVPTLSVHAGSDTSSILSDPGPRQNQGPWAVDAPALAALALGRRAQRSGVPPAVHVTPVLSGSPSLTGHRNGKLPDGIGPTPEPGRAGAAGTVSVGFQREIWPRYPSWLPDFPPSIRLLHPLTGCCVEGLRCER
jgi:hypothetical protein